MLFNRLILCCSLLLLQACVFTPLYYHSKTEPQHFTIATIPERQGQLLRNLLREKLRFTPPNPSSCYHVNIVLTSTEAAAGYNTDLTATITRVTYTADVTLRDQDMKEVSNFKATLADFYINAISTYATTKAQEDVENRILNALASQIATKIAVALRVNNAECS